MKFILLYFILLFSNIGNNKIFAQTSIQKTNEKYYLELYFLESRYEEGKYLRGDIYKLGFKKYDFQKMPVSYSDGNRMITLRGQFTIDSSLKTTQFFIASLPLEYPCNTYLNGYLISSRGNIKNGYTNRMHACENILLIPQIIRYDSINDIAFQLYPKENENAPFKNQFIADSETVKSYVFKRNFLISLFQQGFSIVSLIICCFFIFLFIINKKFQTKHSLYFAFLNLSFILCYINNIINFDFANTYIVELISKSGFSLIMYFTLLFLIEYTQILKSKKIAYIAISLLFIPSAISIYFFSSTSAATLFYQKYILKILFIGTILALIITIKAVLKNKDFKSKILFFIYFLNILAVFHDIYYFSILKTKPYVLLVPFVMMFVIITLFFLIAKDQAAVYLLAEEQAKNLKFLNENLEHIVHERTIELNEESEKLTAVNSTKNKLFSIIAHDLRTPFNGILGFLELLKGNIQKLGAAKAEEMLSIIFSLTKNTHNLLENLLSWAKAQSGQIKYSPEVFNLYLTCEEIVEDLQPTSDAKNIQIAIEFDYNTEIYGDIQMIQTIFRNLLSNAIKYSNQNGTIRIIAKKINDKIEIGVSDNGIGMKQEYVNNLFIKSSNESRYGTNNEKGSGLGLIICKEFIEKHNSKLIIESKEGEGSTFKFMLPIQNLLNLE